MEELICTICGTRPTATGDFGPCNNAECQEVYNKIDRRIRETKRLIRLGKREESPLFSPDPKYIRYMREKKDLIRNDLALRLGYKSKSRQSILYNWETGRRPVPKAIVPWLYYILDIPMDEMLAEIE